MSALADVAARAGVSKATASRALSGRGSVALATRERVLRAAAELGYVASTTAASLVTGRTRNVGVIVPHVNRWFFAHVIEGIESALVASDYDLTLYQLRDDAESRRRIFEYFLVRGRVDAVIAVGVGLSPAEVSGLRALGKPLIGIGGEIRGVETLSIDDVAAGRFATEHLIGLGHSHIVHLGNDTDEQEDFHVHDRRLAGFLTALEAAGLRRDGEFVRVPYSIPGGYEGALELLADPGRRPTAIVGGCDEIAIGALIAASQLGIRVPSELSVIGIDGHDLAEMFALTTLEQDPASQGRRAVAAVLAELDGAHSADAPVTLPFTLRVRRSTTAPTAS